MNHSDVKSLTAKYLDGELPLRLRARFDGHLDQCGECSRELSDMRATIKLLRTLPNPEPPADLVDNVMARIRAGEGQVSWSDRIGDFFAQLRVPSFALPATAVAAGLAVLVVAGDVPLPSGQGSSGTQEQIAMTPGVPSPVTTAQRDDALARPVAPRIVQLQGNPPPSATFVFRSEPLQIGPMIPEPHDMRFPFQTRPPRVGPLLGASAAGDSLATFVSTISPGSPGSGILFQNPPGLTEPLATGGSELTRDERVLRELDARLDVLLSDPRRFAQLLGAGNTQAVQELWLKEIAARAVDREVDREAIEALRSSGVVTSDFLAVFEVAANERIEQQGTSVASQRENR